MSAGIALYRRGARPALLLVRETRGAGAGTWGIPKGAIDAGEDAARAARRELREETGLVVRGPLAELGAVDHAVPHGRTLVFAAAASSGARPRPGYPEVDRAEFVELGRARRLVHPEQRALFDGLAELLRRDLPGRGDGGRGRRGRRDLDVEIEDYLAGGRAPGGEYPRPTGRSKIRGRSRRR